MYLEIIVQYKNLPIEPSGNHTCYDYYNSVYKQYNTAFKVYSRTASFHKKKHE